MKNNLTVVIPFLNENSNLYKTLSSIRETAQNNIDIIIVNDCSTDEYPYDDLVRKFNCLMHKNTQRLGVAASRDLGVSMCKSKYVMLLDGHMKFYESNWNNKVINEISANERAIYSTRSIALDEGWNEVESLQNGLGAYIRFEKSLSRTPFSEEWLRTTTGDGVIPCILGAAYAFSKDYYTKLGGLAGLKQWGSDEIFLSLKVFLEGGRCKLIDNVKVGHVYRSTFPYPQETIYATYNKLFIIYTLFPERVIDPYINSIRGNLGFFSEAYELIKSNMREISEQRKKFTEVLDLDKYYEFSLFNSKFRLAEGALL